MQQTTVASPVNPSISSSVWASKKAASNIESESLGEAIHLSADYLVPKRRKKDDHALKFSSKLHLLPDGVKEYFL
ncbi:MAG: hypothetical protein PVF53_01355, partial [Desulfobacterales bacterium]